jgi:diguanylate cyclase (GGDEF)-like protein
VLPVITRSAPAGSDVDVPQAAGLGVERYVQFVASLPLGVLILELLDLNDTTSFVIRAANPAVDHFSPAPLAGSIGRRLIDVRPELFEAAGRPLLESVANSLRARRPVHIDGLDLRPLGYVDVHVSMWITPLPGNHVAVLVEDVSEIIEARSTLESLAYTDQLTGLPNRAALHTKMAAMLAAADRDSTSVTLALLDMDQFKEVNDAFGHGLGDELLASVAAALVRSAPHGATVARLGGDEFAVITRLSSGEAGSLGDQLRQTFERPLRLNSGLTLQASVSIGLASYPDQADSPETLLQRADVAMYTAKRQNVGCAVYAPELDRSSARRVTLLGDLRRAIDDGELVLHYQPIVEIATGMIRRVEGLIRWEHPELGVLQPAEFIELTELNNLNRGVVCMVVRQGLEALSRWQRSGSSIGLSVNVGGHSLADTELIDDVISLVRAADVPPGSFGLELTERLLLVDPQTSLRSFERLAAAGIRLSIDDFGTGASSLWALREIPADELKIDRAFVDDLRLGDATMIRSIVAMAHAIGLVVVAEGVEDEVTYRWICDSGCDYVQGYLFARPMPAWQVELMFGLPCRPSRSQRDAGAR